MEHAGTPQAGLEQRCNLLAPDALALQSRPEIAMRHRFSLSLGDAGEDLVFGAGEMLVKPRGKDVLHRKG